MLALVNFLKPEKLLDRGGLALLSLIVFAESGLLVGFFLPGDSLLFVAGFLSSDAGHHKLPALPFVVVCVVAAAIVGDQVGYLFGRKVGPALFTRPDSRLFKQQNVMKAQAFIDKYGAKTIVLARFVPIVRTFAPIVAGVGHMRYHRFLFFNVVGGIAWVLAMVLTGYFLGRSIPNVDQHVHQIIFIVIFLSFIPIG